MEERFEDGADNEPAQHVLVPSVAQQACRAQVDARKHQTPPEREQEVEVGVADAP